MIINTLYIQNLLNETKAFLKFITFRAYIEKKERSRITLRS